MMFANSNMGYYITEMYKVLLSTKVRTSRFDP